MRSYLVKYNQQISEYRYLIISDVNCRRLPVNFQLWLVWKKRRFPLKTIILPKQKLQDYTRPTLCPYYPYSSCRGILRELHYGILNGIVMRIKHIRSLYCGLQVKARVKRDDLCFVPHAGIFFVRRYSIPLFLIFCCAQSLSQLTYMTSYI